MLNAYHDESKKLTDEAEELIARGIKCREDAMAMLDRANELAYEYAVAKDGALARPPTDDEIDW